jgi:hypothetical protein
LLFFLAFHLTVFWIFMALDNSTQKSLQKKSKKLNLGFCTTHTCGYVRLSH